MKSLRYLKYNFNNNEIILNNCKLLGVQDLIPTYNGKDLFPRKSSHYIIESNDKKIHFIEVDKVIEIKFEEMVT